MYSYGGSKDFHGDSYWGSYVSGQRTGLGVYSFSSNATRKIGGTYAGTAAVTSRSRSKSRSKSKSTSRSKSTSTSTSTSGGRSKSRSRRRRPGEREAVL